MCASSLGSYGIGDKAKSDREIKMIHGQSVDVLVFEDVDGRINWETREEPLSASHSAVLARFEKLYALTAMVWNKEQQRVLDNALARALFRALSDASQKSAFEHFTAIREEIVKRVLIRARIFYVASGFCFAVALVAVAVVGAVATEAETRTLLVSMGVGAVGAWVSIVQRAWRLTIESFEPPHYLAIQGATRVILGAVFGVFVVVAMKADWVLTMLNDSSWGIASAAFVAGASERLVPEMMRGIEKGA